MTKGKRANEGYGAGGRTGSGDGGAASGGANESHACPANAPHLRKAEVSRLDPLYMTPAACSVCIREWISLREKVESYKFSIPSNALQNVLSFSHVRDGGSRTATFLYSVSSSAVESCPSGNTGGLEGNGLMGFGNARILPSSPNHPLSCGPSRKKEITSLNWTEDGFTKEMTFVGKVCIHITCKKVCFL